MSRLDQGGRIDRSRPLRFTFDGRAFTGFSGDTLASALLANGVKLVGRSFKLHRPRGLMAAGVEEPNAFVAIGEGALLDTNVRATAVELYDGLIAKSLNRWPSLRHDVGSLLGALSRFLPAGFYYKTFMWPNWHLFEATIRRIAGVGRPADTADPDRYEHRHAHCDVLVVGSGPAGVMAALAAAGSGARVMLCEQEPQLGGSLLWDDAVIESAPAAVWLERSLRDLERLGHVQVLRRTTVTGYYDGNSIVALERLTDHVPAATAAGHVRQRLWKIEARRVLLATGALERPLAFPDNDRPGVMLLSAALRYARQYAVMTHRRAVVVVNHDTAYRSVQSLVRCGMHIAAIVDSRAEPGVSARALAESVRVEVIPGSCVAGLEGRARISSVSIARMDGTARRAVPCDGVLMSGGWNPAVHLFSQSGGKLKYNDALGAFVPEHSTQNERSIGAANGVFAFDQLFRDACEAGKSAAVATGYPKPDIVSPPVNTDDLDCGVAPFGSVPDSLTGDAKQWIDFHNDVTTRDVEIAMREGFVAVEHLKRYTTLGMAPDQGKTSNVTGLALAGQLTGRAPSAIGTTRFRAPYTPITFNAIAGCRRGALFQPQRNLPAHDALVELGAVMEDYAGWLRPVCLPINGENEAAAIARETLAVRNGVGITDYSSLGKIELQGPDVELFLNRMVLTDVSSLRPGRARYSLTSDENGVVIDDGIVSRLGANHFLLGTTSGAARQIASRCEEWLQCEWPHLRVFVTDVTTQWGVVLVSGPRSRELIQRLGCDIDFSAALFPHMALRIGSLGGVPLRVHRVSFTGEVSYEIATPAGYVRALWARLMALGNDLGVTPFGMESLLLLRLEKGYLHVGTDTDGTTLPHDLGFRIPESKPNVELVGWRSLSRRASVHDRRRQLVGLTSFDQKHPLPIGGHLFDRGVRRLPATSQGWVTSSAWSPTLQRPVALGMLEAGSARMGEMLRVFGNGRWHEASVSRSCAYDPTGVRTNA